MTENSALNLEKIPQKCARLLLEHLAWIEHQFLSGIRDSRKAGSLWGMMRGVGGVRKSTHQSWLAKGLGLGLLCWRRLDLMIINKGKKGICHTVDFDVPAAHREKIKGSKKREKFLDLASKLIKVWGCPYGIMVKVLDCGIVVCEFEHHSRYYVHCRTNTLEKGMKPLILPAIG